MTLDSLAETLLLLSLRPTSNRAVPISQVARHKTARLNRLRRQHRRARNRIESGWRDAWKDQQGVAW